MATWIEKTFLKIAKHRATQAWSLRFFKWNGYSRINPQGRVVKTGELCYWRWNKAELEKIPWNNSNAFPISQIVSIPWLRQAGWKLRNSILFFTMIIRSVISLYSYVTSSFRFYGWKRYVSFSLTVLKLVLVQNYVLTNYLIIGSQLSTNSVKFQGNFHCSATYLTHSHTNYWLISALYF